MKWIKIEWIIGTVIVILTVVIGLIISDAKEPVRVIYLAASEVVVLIALLRQIHFARKDME